MTSRCSESPMSSSRRRRCAREEAQKDFRSFFLLLFYGRGEGGSRESQDLIRNSRDKFSFTFLQSASVDFNIKCPAPENADLVLRFLQVKANRNKKGPD